MNPTNIEWTNIFGPGTGFTYNPIVGCTEGCPYCYARRQAKRQKHNCELCYMFTPHLHSERLEQPLKRKKPSGIFLGSMTDLWDPHVPQAWRDQVWGVVAKCPQHVFWVLTKQPQNMTNADCYATAGQALWTGVSYDGNPLWGERRIEELGAWTSDTEFNPHFVSLEPLLREPGSADVEIMASIGVEWLIVGAQTGPGAPLPQREWIDRIVDDADEHGIVVFLKDNLAPVMGDNLRQEWPERMKLNV